MFGYLKSRQNHVTYKNYYYYYFIREEESEGLNEIIHLNNPPFVTLSSIYLKVKMVEFHLKIDKFFLHPNIFFLHPNINF